MANERSSSKIDALPVPTPPCPPRINTKESAKAYSAFKQYFEMGDARHLPNLAKNGNFALKSVYTWAKRSQWDARIDDAYYNAQASYRRASERAIERHAVQLVRQRMEISAGNHKIALAMQAKTLDIINGIKVLETLSTQTSKDGKTIHITVRPAAGIRLTDAARLALAANAVMQQATALVVPKANATGKHDTAPDGTPLPNSDGAPPEVVLFLDTGDGKPQPLSFLPPPDQVNPYFNPLDGTSSAPVASEPTAQLGPG